jgi:hypothetical protein
LIKNLSDVKNLPSILINSLSELPPDLFITYKLLDRMCTSKPRTSRVVRFDTVQVFEYQQETAGGRKNHGKRRDREDHDETKRAEPDCLPEKVDLDFYEMTTALNRISADLYHCQNQHSSSSSSRGGRHHHHGGGGSSSSSPKTTSKSSRRRHKQQEMEVLKNEYEAILAEIEGAVRTLSLKLDTLDASSSSSSKLYDRAPAPPARCA